MVDQFNGQQLNGNGNGASVRAIVERSVENIWLKFLARVLMVVGGTVAIPALGLIGLGVGLLFEMRDDWRDWKKAMPAYALDIKALKEADLGIYELRGTAGRHGTAIEELQREDRRTASHIEGLTTRVQSLEFQNRGR